MPGPIPERFRGGQFVGLLIRESQSGISAILHHIGEGATEVEKRQVAIDLKSVVAEPGGPIPLDLANWVAKDATIDLQGGALADPQRPRRRLGDRPRRPADRRAHAAGDRRPGHGRGRPRRRRSTSTWPARPALRGQVVGTLQRFPTAGDAVHRRRPARRCSGRSTRTSRPRARPARSGSAASGRVDPAVRDAPFNRLVLHRARRRGGAAGRRSARPRCGGAAAAGRPGGRRRSPSSRSRWWCAATCERRRRPADARGRRRHAVGAAAACSRVRTGHARADRDRPRRALRRGPDARRDAAGRRDGHRRRPRAAARWRPGRRRPSLGVVLAIAAAALLAVALAAAAGAARAAAAPAGRSGLVIACQRPVLRVPRPRARRRGAARPVARRRAR